MSKLYRLIIHNLLYFRLWSADSNGGELRLKTQVITLTIIEQIELTSKPDANSPTLYSHEQGLN